MTSKPAISQILPAISVLPHKIVISDTDVLALQADQERRTDGGFGTTAL